ncbi:MAG: carboxymuconolactone decarboxylase family protein [Desulfobacterales bacterium]
MSTKNKSMYLPTTPAISKKRADLAPDQVEAFRNFSKTVFKPGAIDEKTKQLIAVAAAHVTQCPYCIKGHTRLAKQKGATNNEIMEAIWVASEMRAGAAYAHAALAVEEMETNS